MLIASGDDLIVRLKGGPDQITIRNHINYSNWRIEQFSFLDGTVWSLPEITARTLTLQYGPVLVGTQLDDTLAGGALAETISGGIGNDTLSGNGNDDRLAGEEGDDSLDGGAGNDYLTGATGDDILRGGTGDDSLVGGLGSDTYVFAAGDGRDTVADQGSSSADILRIEGYALSRMRFSARGDDLVIRFSESEDKVVVTGGLGAGAYNQIESFVIMESGVTLGLEDVRQMLVEDIATTGAWLPGTPGDDVLAGTGSDDYLAGGDGADSLAGGDGDDQFAGVSGDGYVDTLTGGAGRDSYYFIPVSLGSEVIVADVVTDFTPGDDGDIVRLATGSPNPFEGGGLRLVQSGPDTVLIARAANGAEQIVLRLAGVTSTDLTAANFSGLPIEADNSLSISDDDAGHLLEAGPLNDRVYGNGGDDTIFGYAGNDMLAGGAGEDVIDGGFGDDLLSGQDGNDTLIGGEGSDVLSGGTGDDTLTGYGDGSSALDSDVFEGGEGDDSLQGGTGDDVYRFSRGDGRDAVTDLAGADSLIFTADVTPENIVVVQVGNDIELRIDDDGGRIRLTGAANGGTTTIEAITFSDGSAWSWQDVLDRSMIAGAGDDVLRLAAGAGTLSGLGGNDSLTGSDSNDTLVGGTGNDSLMGGLGDDTYLFALGDGQDLIDDADGVNTLRFSADVAPSQVRLARSSANFVLEIIGTSDRIDLGSPAAPGMGVSQVVFDADGSVWSEATLIAMARAASDGGDVIRGDALDNVLAGGAGDDLIQGGDGADSLDGGLGSDRLEGGKGNDTYAFQRDGGHDRIADSAGSDTLQLADGITPDGVTVLQSRNGADFTLVVDATGARVTIEDALGTGRIETIAFADGTVWTTDDLIARAPTIGDDVLTGDAGDNLLIGGLGNDTLSGGGGNDTYRFARGDGSDVIRDGASSTADVLEITGYAVGEISFHRLGSDSNDVAIRFAGTDDRIVIANALAGGSAGIETIVLDDGTTYAIADVRLAVLADLATSGNDTVIGTSGDDTLSGGPGNDLIAGGAGNDTYLYARGDGDDRIDAFGSGANVLSLSGYVQADILSAVRGGPDSNDLIVTFADYGDRLVLVDALANGNGSGGNSLTVQFADGSTWNRDAMRARALSDIDGGGNDNAYGFDGDDSFAARAGNDLLAGAGGSDVYAFGLGSGHDTVSDAGTSGTDTIRIADFASTDASVERLYRGSDAVVIRFTGNDADSLTVIDAVAADAKGIESIEFADGVTWTKDILRNLLDNRAPVAADDGFFSVTTGEELVIAAADILNNDFDADGDSLRIVAVDGGANGVATIDADGNVHYTAIGGYYGPASISYTLADGRNGFDSGNIDLRVRPVATALPDDDFSVAEDESLVIRVERLLSNDLDGDRMVVGQVYGATHGSVSLSSDGNISFTPDANYNGTAEFTYVANTPEGGRAEAKVTIAVTAVNDAPVAHNDSAPAIAEGSAFTLDPRVLTANDSDIDGDVLTVTSVQSNANVTATIGEDGLIHVAPADYYWGSAYFDYVVSDPSGTTSTGRVTFDVTPVNDPPELHDDRFDTTEAGDPILEDNPIVIGADRLLANDIEHDGDVMTVVAVANAHGGSAKLLDNDTVLFTPNADFNGDAWFDYQVGDGHGGLAWARATIAYQAVNDRPVARDDSYARPGLEFLHGLEDTPIEIPIIELTKNDYDPEGYAVAFESAGSAVHGSIEITDHGTIIFTPDANYWGEATFSYLVSDNEGLVDAATVTLAFDNVGDGPPVANADVIYVNEDIPTVIPISALLANDTDIDLDTIEFVGYRIPNNLDALTYGADAAKALNGTLEYDADGNILFTPNRDATVSSGLVYRVTDNADGTADGYLDIVILPSNDDPTVNDDFGFVTPLDAPLVLRVSDLLENDYDIEQADGNGDGIVDGPLDDPNRPRPTFVGIEGVYLADQLELGQRVPVGDVEVATWNGEQFVVVRFPEGFTGQVAVEYRIADAEGATDTGFAMATVSDFYDGVLQGTQATDYLAGTPGADLIRGLASADFILGGAGNDTIEAGDGDDRIDAGAGDDLIDGGDGADGITGGAGYDTVTYANSDVGVRADLESRVGQGGWAQGDVFLGVEALIGTQFADQLYGDAADNRLEGLGGNDILDGRDGNDTLIGGDGDDTLTGGAGADVIDGGEGIDTADYSFGSTGVSISLAGGTASGGDAEGDVLTGIENLTGTDVADMLEGDDGANVLSGGRGDDLLVGGGGNDTLIGGRGADQMVGGEGEDIADYTLSAEGVTIDMANGAAGSGDAEGDTFSSIEIVQGSYHDDAIYGTDGENRIRGGRGADVIDGRGGFDTADYSKADEGVSVDLSTGMGTAGEAAGDTLISIEKLVGSLWDDTFSGGSGNDTFEGLRGDDTLAGGFGSDTYLFGFDGGNDTIAEQGDATDIDRLVLDAAVAPKDVSILREGGDLLIEFERQDGFLIDTVRVTDHFLGVETGIEEIAFADGTVWDRDRIDQLQRLGRFNAADDIVRFAVEDEPVVIDPADLIVNDAEAGTLDLQFVGADRPTHGTVQVRDDGMIEFLGDQDFNGDGYFYYTVRDEFGRESSARVEVNISPVNDAPTAVDDPLVYGVEDEILHIRIENLLANDFDVDGLDEGLHIVSFAPLLNDAGQEIDRYKNSDHAFAGTNVTGSIGGSYIDLMFRPDYFGAAGFLYTLADASGATSTAKVEIYVTPVNDAPRAHDTRHSVRLETTATLTVADLLANSYDIEGDAITFVGLHPGADENAAINGAVTFDPDTGEIVFTPASLGEAGIEYDVIDERGAAATLTYRFKVRPLNDPPKANNDYGLRTLEDQLLVIDPASLLANDTDPNGDVLTLESISRFADNGKVLLRDDGMIEFRPRSDFNGSAGFDYTITDGRGGTSSAHVSITILPRNDSPILRNDLVAGFEDGPLFVIPAEAFGNDIEPDGDVIFFKRASVLGVVDHRYLSADFTAEARLADGSALPGSISFDPDTMTFSGSLPGGVESVNADIWITDPANGRVFNSRQELSAGTLGVSLRGDVLEGYQIRSGFAVDFEFGANDLDASTTITATLEDGSELPSWLVFDIQTLSFTGTPPEGTTDPVAATLTFSRVSQITGETLTWADAISLDPAALTDGIVYDSNLALFDLKNGTVSASLIGGRPLPDWFDFDGASRTISLSGFEPDADAQLARLQVVFTPAARDLANGVYASSDKGFTLEFLLDPQGDLAAQVDAVNRALAGDPYFADQGLFALDLGEAGAITATRESGAPLDSWLTFDAATLSFEGTPPPSWIGAVPVRMDIAAGGSLPAMSVITEAVVDDTFSLSSTGLGVATGDERIDLTGTRDFNGTLVISYDATDEKGGVSDKPALIFYDIKPQRERPDTGADLLATHENESLRFAVTDLLGNDFDRDGDPLRITALGAPANGTLALELGQLAIDPPAELAAVEGAVWTATLADGSDLPSWLVIDADTGAISGEIPLDFTGALDITVTRTANGEAASASVRRELDGNAGAFVLYTPDDAFAGDDGFTYTVTDDREGSSAGVVTVRVASLFDPPVAVEDHLSATEDTPLAIDPQVLLANDYDVDGDPIRFLDVANPQHGTLSFDGTQIVFTPDHNFSGEASFEYVVTDDNQGPSTGLVKINVVSTNRGPVAGADTFAAVEDTPFEFTTADLLANDSDPDGDAISFQSLSRSAEGGRIVELPGGRWQFVPDENVNGPVSFRYTIGDGRKSATGTVTFDIAAVNDAPVANPDGAGTANDPEGVFRTLHDTPLTVDFSALLANDRDVEGDDFSIVEIFDGDQGTVEMVGSTAVFTPDADYVGDAGFHYRVTDSHGDSSVGYATLLVLPDEPLPIPVSDLGLEMLEDTWLDIDPALLLANDVVPEGSTVTFLGLEGAVLQEDGTYRVTPAPDFYGQLELRYSIQDEQGIPLSALVTVNVLPVADAPIAGDDALATAEDTPLTIFASQLLDNDSDADHQAFFISRILDTAGVTVTDLGFGQLQITPDADFAGEASFVYEIEDSTGLTGTARVTVDVAAVNDAPVIAAIPVLQGTEDQPFSATLPAGFASDVDGDALVVEVRAPGGGALLEWLTFDRETRTLFGTPPQDFNGTVTLEVAAFDGQAETVRDLLVSIAPVNDAPALGVPLADLDASEDTPFAFALAAGAFGDVDGDALSFAVTLEDGSPLPGWLSFGNGTLSGTPPQDFNGALALTMTASDGEYTVSDSFVLTVSAVNDAPVLTGGLADVSVAEDTAIDFTLPAGSFSDVDGDALALSARLANGDPLPGWLTFAEGRFTGTPPQDYNGVIGITVSASDGVQSASDSFILTVTPVNDAPALTGSLANIHVAEDGTVDFALPDGTFTDVDGDPLALSAAQSDGSALPGWLSFDGTRFTGTPPANFNGSLGITVTAGDGELATQGSFTLTIDPVNDAPVLVTPLADLDSAEDTAMAFSLALESFADVDGDPLAFSARLADGSALPDWLTLSDGILSGTPPQDFNGALDIEILASDGLLAAGDVFRLTIDPVNDAPVLTKVIGDMLVAEDHAFALPLPLDAFADVDGDLLAFSVTQSDGTPLPGWMHYADGQLTGTPPQDFNGALGLAITASDGALSVTANFVFTVLAVNDAPVIAHLLPDISSAEDAAIDLVLDAGAFSDVDGDTLTLTARRADGSALPAWLAFDGNRFTGTPPQNFNGYVDITVYASDGLLSVNDTFRLTVSSVNDAPVLTLALADQDVLGGYPIDIAVPAGTFTDVDGDALTLSATLADGSALPGWLSFDGTRFTGTTANTFGGEFDITVTASDGEFAAADDFHLTITPSNVAPVAQDDGLFVTTSNRAITIDPQALLDNDTDVNGDVLSVVSFDSPVGGEVAFDESGYLVFTPDAAFTGTASFRYTITDGELTSSATVLIRVDPSDQFDAYRQGGSGTDVLIGNLLGTNKIFGGAGNDILTGGLRADELAGGDGNDFLLGLSGDDQFWGGQGDDILMGGGGTDTAHFFGYRSTYSVVSQSGLLRIKVGDNAADADGNDGSDRLSSIERLAFKGGETVNIASPIVLDFDGQGVTTVSAADSKARYDLDGDGLADDTSWIGNTEGFLFLDRDGNGTVSNAGEFSFVDDVEGAASDLAGLAAYDSNGDGVLSSADARFSDFRVWLDADGDGAADEGEVYTLDEAYVSSINLTGTAYDGTTQFGDVAILNTGSYTRTDGSTLGFIDAALTYFAADTNLPDFAPSSFEVAGQKSKHYYLNVSGGTVSLMRKGHRTWVTTLETNTVVNFRNESWGMLSPIVLDLDGDGVELKNRRKASAYYDMNGDGVRDDTGWIAREDGFLVIDRNNDGMITETSELSLAAEEGATSDLAGLAHLDSNADGIVDATDARFGELKVWIDANGNGMSEVGELHMLTELGIAAFNIKDATATPDAALKVGSNALLATSSFTRTDDTTGVFGESLLAYKPGRASSAPAVVGSGFRYPGALFAGVLNNDIINAIDVLRSNGRPEVVSISEWLSDSMPFDTVADQLSAQSQEEAASLTAASSAGGDETVVRMPSYNVAPLIDVVESGVDSASRLALLRQDMAAFSADAGFDAMEWKGAFPERGFVFM
ncbi:tandem-95 repeat protein [Novosphingobium beihaiensis]|uniref:tandem-95 repeat protein n=1 Tax=Novosphingobium beihaiensis TaxID=2930389 RepID=UPI002E132844